MKTEAVNAAAARGQVDSPDAHNARRGAKAGMGEAESRVERAEADVGYDYGETYGGCLEDCFRYLEPWLPTCVFECLLSVTRCVYQCFEQICGWNRPAPAEHADEEDETHHDTGTVRTRETDAVEHDGPTNLQTTIGHVQKLESNSWFLHTKASHIYSIVEGSFSFADWNEGDPISIDDDFQTPKDGTQSCTNLKSSKTMRVKMYLVAGA